MNFKNKNILIITPFFFDYHNRIERELKKLGANVDVINEKMSNSFLSKLCSRLNLRLYYPVINAYYEKKIKQLNRDYDAVLWIKCESATEDAIKLVKNTYKKARQILFLWDSIDNIRGIKKKLYLFDDIYSFDPCDVKQNENFKYAYWGFTDEFALSKENAYDYDIAFVGTMHSIRPAVISAIKDECNKKGLRLYLYQFMPFRLLFFYRKLFCKAFKDLRIRDIHFKALSSDEMIDIYKRSKAVLEIEEANQSGATTRLGEMIGMNKKLITTFNCRDKDYYRPTNQYILNPNDVVINKSFFDTEYEKLPEDIYKKYSFTNFLNLIFENI